MDSDRDEAEYGGDYYYPPDDDDAPEEGRRVPDDGTYWRRRFLILCGGVAALGACAWLFPAAHQPSARASADASAAAAAAAKRQALPPAALASAWPGPTPTASPSPASAAYPTAPAAQVKQKTGPAASPGTATATPAAAAAAGGARRCAAGDIVLSLFTSQPGYDPVTPPAFNVYAVSTSGTACTLPYGAGSVQVVVTRDGQVVWDSAACKPPAAQPVRFTPGVPQVLTMTWNRKAAGPAGCAGSLPAGASGTLDAVALEGSQSSAVRTFKLDR
jgi:hypothetical protein